MGTSLFAADVLFARLQQLARWLARSITGAPAAVRPLHPAAGDGAAASRSEAASAARPVRLRVVRVVEGPHPAVSAGRMVISGRMADVCAELERLAALEAAAG